MWQVQQLPTDRQAPAIALTAYAGEVDRQQAIAAGFLAHLSKPVEPVDVVATIARVCGRKQGASGETKL